MPQPVHRLTPSITSEPPCYFSFIPNPSDHYSTETPLSSPDLDYDPPTPLADPCNPLLALRPHSALLTSHIPMEASRLMQFQTNAAHSDTPAKALPMQDVLHVDYEGSHTYSRSNSASSNNSNGSVNSGFSPLSTCSRCQTQGSVGFVRYTMNSYYCPRCAKIVGFGG